MTTKPPLFIALLLVHDMRKPQSILCYPVDLKLSHVIVIIIIIVHAEERLMSLFYNRCGGFQFLVEWLGFEAGSPDR